MMRKFFILGAILGNLLSWSLLEAFAADDPKLDEVCRQTRCRTPTAVHLNVPGGGSINIPFSKTPFVAEGETYIFMGEEVNIEFPTDGKPGNPVFVEKAVNPLRTVTIRVSQEGTTSILFVQNPFDRTLLYDCFIQYPVFGKDAELRDPKNPPEIKQWTENTTTVIPIQPKLASYESWPYPVGQVVLQNFRFK